MSMAIHSRTSNLGKGTLPYMTPDKLISIITLNPAGPGILYVSVKLNVYSLYSMVIIVAISYQELTVVFILHTKLLLLKTAIQAHLFKKSPFGDLQF